MHMNFSNLRPRTRMYNIRYKSRIICKNVGNIKTKQIKLITDDAVVVL